MTTLKSRRNMDRLRQRKWRKRQMELGKKQVTAMISLKAQILLNREKRTSGESTSQIIERALLALASHRSVQFPKPPSSPIERSPENPQKVDNIHSL